ncbi:ArsR family transcriptional regulator [Dasania marina]|uniref:ArsR family transcriptional regulator n=1 Tax=Dasania marina TaxID=471499 RepID=UPI0004B74DD9|nr:ArsR family transcriptional regulator [Dasania marina]
MFIAKGILKAESQEKALLYLFTRKEGYAKAIADFYQCPVTPIVNQLNAMEDDGIVVSKLVGRSRVYQLNTRAPLYSVLEELLRSTLALYPKNIAQSLIMNRIKPRAKRKPIINVRERVND